MATRKIVPRADNEGGLGTALKRWASAFINALTVNTISLIGGQIAFPAAQAPSSNVNTLDDYEEGTWTPALSFGGGTTGIEYISRPGDYIKIGKMVMVSAWIFLSSKGTSVGDALITGLPFTIGGTSRMSANIGLNNVTFTGQYRGWAYSGQSVISLMENPEAAVPTTLTNADFANNSEVYLSFIYPAA